MLSECDCYSNNDIEIRNSETKYRPIEIRIPVDSIFLTRGKIEFVEHYEVSVAYHL